MNFIYLLLVCALLAATMAEVISISGPHGLELWVWQQRVKTVQKRVEIECRGKFRRDLAMDQQNQIRTEQAMYRQLLNALRNCQAANAVTSIPSTVGDPCVSSTTVTLTESWRLDNAGSNLKPVNGDYNCDKELTQDRIWFRFSGDAGTQLLNTCPKDLSCGSHGGFWSDAQMPEKVGEIKQVPLYGSFQDCKRYKWPVQHALTVKRCSEKKGDFVYKAHGTGHCNWSFCSMK